MPSGLGAELLQTLGVSLEGDPLSACLSTGHFLNADFFLSVGALQLHLFGEIRCAGDCFLVVRSSSAAQLVCTQLTSPHSEPSRLCKLVVQAAVGQCPSPL